MTNDQDFDSPQLVKPKIKDLSQTKLSCFLEDVFNDNFLIKL
jgi:hypothetical protein